MTKRQQVAQINAALTKVCEEISALAAGGSRYAGGLAGEGYAGGYRDALSDVLLVLNSVRPDRRNYWVSPVRDRVRPGSR